MPDNAAVAETVSILDGSTFLVCDRRGDVDASPSDPHGFFFRDTRFLSRWLLTANGEPLNVLSTDETDYFHAQFFLTPQGTRTASVIRKRIIGDGFHEDISVLNHNTDPLGLTLRLDADADFADLFEVTDALEKKGKRYRRIDGETLVLGYERGDSSARRASVRRSPRSSTRTA